MRGQKPFRDDCVFVAARTPNPYQLDRLLEHCTESLRDDSITVDFIGFRVNLSDWDEFVVAANAEGVELVPHGRD